MPITKKFTENIFADSRKAAKFMKILSLEKIPLYSTSCVFEETRPMKLYMFVFQGGGEFHATCQRRPCFCFSALSLFMFFVYYMCSVPLYGVIRMNSDELSRLANQVDK